MTATPASKSPKDAPASGGIRSKLTEAQRAMLASKSGGGAPGAAKTVKKVRW